MEKHDKNLGNPRVSPAPQYDTPAGVIANMVVRAPATMTSNVYVMAELQRRLDNFWPKRILDFGAGVGVATMAAGRVFRRDEADSAFRSESEVAEMGEKSTVRDAMLIDQSSTVRSISEKAVKLDDNLKGTRFQHVASLSSIPEKDGLYDLVVASYSLNELVRDAMAKPQKADPDTEEGIDVHPTRNVRTRLAEKRLKKTIMKLWDKTAPGGVFVIIEDGTAAGFEVVLFARECVLWGAKSDESKAAIKRLNALQDATKKAQVSENEAELSAEKVLAAKNGARVLAPCVHSKQCPLLGSVTRHRLCRFTQRYNRPPFLRHNRPMPNGFQDEYFSYIVIQKLHPTEGDEAVYPTVSLDERRIPDESVRTELVSRQKDGIEASDSEPWGRLLRAPLMRGKHIALDACTVDGTLERRVVTKRNSGQGFYALARRSKWGDIWTVRPKTKPQQVNF